MPREYRHISEYKKEIYELRTIRKKTIMKVYFPLNHRY